MNQKQKIKIGLQIAGQMKKLNLKKSHVALFAEISRTQLDKILHADNDYTIDTLLKVLKAVDLEINLKSTGIVQLDPEKPVKKAKKAVKTKKSNVIGDKSPKKIISWP